MPNLLQKASIVLTPTAYDDGKVLCAKPSKPPYGDFDFSRNSAATRVNAQGLVENVQILSSNLVQNGSFSQEGSELITNGNFDTDSDWVKGTGITISNGQANFTGVSGQYLSQDMLTSGKSYKLTFNVTDYTSGILTIFGGSGNNISSIFPVNSTGIYTGIFISGGTNNRLYFGSTFNGSIDNVSVKEVGQDWVFGTGWSVGEDKAVAVSGASTKLIQSISGLSGKKCSVTFTLSNYGGNGNIKLDFGSVVGQNRNANGTYTEVGTYDIDRLEFYKNAGFEGSITNISVIEITDDTNLPRINYEGFSYDGSGNVVPDSGCGSWLWEPQSTNLITYSEDYSQWDVKTRISITNNIATSPSGDLNASKIIPTSTSGTHQLRENLTSVTGNYTYSIFAKKGEYKNILLWDDTLSGGVGVNLDDLSVFRDQNNQGYKIVDFGNDWIRISLTHTFSSQIMRPSIYIYDNSATPQISFAGNDVDGLFTWGAQVEEQTYATSYIPTDGTTVTRNQDVCTNGGSLASINSTEGVLYAEIAALADDLTFRSISLSDGTTNNVATIRYRTNSNRIQVVVFSGGVLQFSNSYDVTNILDFNKVAISYNQSDFNYWVNGVKRANSTSGNTPIGMNKLSFDNGGSHPFYGKTKCLAVWKEALSDEELTELTTI